MTLIIEHALSRLYVYSADSFPIFRNNCNENSISDNLWENNVTDFKHLIGAPKKEFLFTAAPQ